MLTKLFFIFIGFGFTVIGMIYIISYLNYITIGYNFLEYVNFIIRRAECLFAPIGLIILFVAINFTGGKKHELYL